MTDEIDRFVRVLNAWDRLDGAIKDVLTSQPHQLTQAAADLREQQGLMAGLLRRETLTMSRADFDAVLGKKGTKE